MAVRPDPRDIPAHWVDQRYSECDGFEGGHAVRAIGEVLFATADGGPPEDRLRWLACRVDGLRTRVRGRGMLVFALCLWVVYRLAPLWSFRFRSLGALPLDRRIRVLERWERSPFGMSLFAVKAILCIVWFEHPDAAAGIGFDGTSMESSQAARGPLG